ncbi:MAG: TatD family hydrolase [Proteobacteria bacterium]|jgi:TatD DNase family protein|nr:TatD family hydrolase [Pseudomonadota bacterium]
MSRSIDSHSHLADPRIQSRLDAWIVEARLNGMTAHLQGGVNPEDWARQLELQALYPEIWPVFGLHPYWVAGATEEQCEQGLDQLARKLGKAYALGETGLDFRSQFLANSELGSESENRHRQIRLFEQQLELARVGNKAVVLHVVRAFSEFLVVWDEFGAGLRGFYHSFAGDWQKAKQILDRGLLVSVGAAILYPRNEALRSAVQRIPLDRLLIETDCPDQPPPSYQGELNPPVSLFLVADKVAEIKGLAREEVLDSSGQNLRKLLQL